jgi:hypothetical protein
VQQLGPLGTVRRACSALIALVMFVVVQTSAEESVVDKQRPVFGRPKNWDKMTPEQKHEWALSLLRAATETPQKG